jgi:hypothetical protein
VPATAADAVAAPQCTTDRERLEKPPDPAVERHACRLKLLADCRHVAGDADAENEAPLDNAVEGTDDVGEHNRVAQGRQKHSRAPPHARRVRAVTAASSVSGSWGGRAVRESPTQTESKPAASARSAMASIGAVSGKPDLTASRVGSRTPNSTECPVSI